MDTLEGRLGEYLDRSAAKLTELLGSDVRPGYDGGLGRQVGVVGMRVQKRPSALISITTASRIKLPCIIMSCTCMYM